MQTPPPFKSAIPSFGRETVLRHDLWGKLIRFGAVGVLNTIIDYAVFVFCIQIIELQLLVANTVAFLVAVGFGYVMNKSWTFRDDSRGRVAIARGVLFLGSYTVGFLLGSAALWLVSLYIDPRLAKLASIGTSFVVNFILSKMVVFRST